MCSARQDGRLNKETPREIYITFFFQKDYKIRDMFSDFQMRVHLKNETGRNKCMRG